MNLLKRFFKYFLGLLGLLILVVLIVIGINYKSDIDVEVLKEKYAFEDSKYIEIEGIQVHYRQTGTGHPFVLLHGFGANLWNWEKWTKLLKDDYQIISLDLPGYGLTGPRADRDYSTEKYIVFLDQFFEKIGIDTFYLAGNSMGGGFAWQYTLEHSEKVKKLVLINAGGYPKDSTDGETIKGFQVLKMPFVKKLVTKITPRSILTQTVKDVYGDKSLATEEEVDFYMDIIRREGNRQVLVDRMNRKKVKDRSVEIKNIKTPTLILWGDQDLLISYHHAYKFERDIEDSKAIIYKNVGHIPMVEIPEQSAEDVRIFLEEE